MNLIAPIVIIVLFLGLVYIESWTNYKVKNMRVRLNSYRMAVEELDKWCGHKSQHARLIAAHLKALGEGRSLNAGTPINEEPCTVSGLREQLARADALFKPDYSGLNGGALCYGLFDPHGQLKATSKDIDLLLTSFHFDDIADEMWISLFNSNNTAQRQQIFISNGWKIVCGKFSFEI